MLAYLERGRIRELRHDFRHEYHIAYDDVTDIDEAIDLITTLPPGSLYQGKLNVKNTWSELQYQIADMTDLLLLINWRLANCSDRVFMGPSMRPGDAEKQAKARAKAHNVRKRIEELQRKAQEKAS